MCTDFSQMRCFVYRERHMKTTKSDKDTDFLASTQETIAFYGISSTILHKLIKITMFIRNFQR